MAGALSIGTWATLGALPRLLLTWLVISCLAFTTAGMYSCAPVQSIYTVKKRLAVFPSPAGMSLTKLSLDGNNKILPGQGGFGK